MSNDVLNRFERLLEQTFLYLKDQCTDVNLSRAMGRYLLQGRHRDSAYKIDVMTDVLSNEEWLVTPDIHNQIFSVLKLIYLDAAQPIFDVLWAEAYKREIVDSVIAPEIEVELLVGDILSRAHKICEGIDRGTIAYLAKLLLDDDYGKDFNAMRQFLFDSGGGNTDSLADIRIRNIVNTETCWARNLCGLGVLRELKLGKKEWTKGAKECGVAEANESVSSVPLDYLYKSNYEERVLAPPGCVGCDCRIRSSFDQDLLPLREVDSSTNRILDGVLGSGIVCIVPPEQYRTLLGVKNPHITLVYLGKKGSDFWHLVELAVKKVCKEIAPFPIYLTGDTRTLGVPNRGDVDVALVANSKELRRLKEALEDALRNEYVVEFSEWKEWTPHITLGDAHTVSDDMIEDFGDPWVVEGVELWVGNKSEKFELEAREKVQVVESIHTTGEEEDMIDRLEEKAIRYGFRYSKSFVFDEEASNIVFDIKSNRYVCAGSTPAMVKAFFDGPDQRPLDALRWLKRSGYNVIVAESVRDLQEKTLSENKTYSRDEVREMVSEIVKSSAQKESVHVHMPDVNVPPVNINATLSLPAEFSQPIVKNEIILPKQDAPNVTISPPNITIESPIIKNEITMPETKVVMQAQPAPIVNVAAPEVFVRVPEQKIDVHVPKSTINVNIPEQPAPIVKQTITIPKQDPVNVNVTVNPELKAELTMPDSEEEEQSEIIRNKDKEIVGAKKKIKRTYRKK